VTDFNPYATSVPVGGRIILACRDLTRAQAAVDDIKKRTSGIEGLGELVTVHLDLSSLASVRECAQYLLRTEERIHLLINNAGESHDVRCWKPRLFL
jgi:NAD(P)-dependent dehydrogenase (short-subunit alcohol dehydrogenase family)